MTECTTPETPKPTLWARVFSRENLLAVAVCLILVVVVIMTADNAPRWIYQGF